MSWRCPQCRAELCECPRLAEEGARALERSAGALLAQAAAVRAPHAAALQWDRWAAELLRRACLCFALECISKWQGCPVSIRLQVGFDEPC